MAYEMSTSLDPDRIRAEVHAWLNSKLEDPYERAFWGKIFGLSRKGWYLRRTEGSMTTIGHGTQATETGAVYGSGDQLVVHQVWKEVGDVHMSAGIRAISLKPEAVARLGQLILCDDEQEGNFGIALNDWVARNAQGFQKVLSMVLRGADHTEITGHVSMNPDQIREEGDWILAQIAAAGAVPNPDITRKLGPAL